MEQLPKKAKTVMGIYATAATVAQETAIFFGVSREDFVVFSVTALIVAVVSSYVYIVLYFRNYRYSISGGVITIKKGALFKRRHLIYVDKISLITVRESFVHRWFGLCTVWFHAQGSVVKLSYVEVAKSAQLQKILDSRN